MPIIRSAIKKLRKDKKRTERNKAKKINLKALIKKARENKSAANLRDVFSALDKAAKTNLIHKNKASRLKSRLSKLITQPSITSDSKSSRLKSRLSKTKPTKKPAKKVAKP